MIKNPEKNSNINLGLNYLNKQDSNSFEFAFNLFLKEANSGNPLGMLYLGKILYDQNRFEEAFHWIELAAFSNIPEAQYLLGIMYEEGKGVNSNFNTSTNWMIRAADNGSIEAMRKLTHFGPAFGSQNIELYAKKAAQLNDLESMVFYAHLLMHEKNYSEMKRWFYYAALKGNSMSMWLIGDIYYHGKFGSEINKQTAYNWFKKSYQEKHPYSYSAMAEVFFDKDWIKFDPKKGLEFLKEGSKNNSPKAKLDLAKLLLEGKFVKQNKNLAFEILSEIKDLKSDEEDLNLFLLDYYIGECNGLLAELLSDPDLEIYSTEEAINRARIGAASNEENSKSVLVKLLKEKSVNPNSYDFNKDEYLYWLNQETGFIGFTLAQELLSGNLIQKDIDRALNILEQNNSKNSEYLIGSIYESGLEHINKNIPKAIYYYKKALENPVNWNKYLQSDDQISNEIIRKKLSLIDN